jgi:DnaD/phage-associated family protein
MRAIKKLSNEGYISIHYPSNTKREVFTSTKNCTPTKNGSTKNCTPTKNGSELVQKFVSTSTKNSTQVYKDNKKENSSIYDPLKPFIDFYNNNIEILTPHNLTILQSYVEDYGEEWTMKALEYVAEADRGKRNIKYVGGVLKGWERDGELRPWEKQKCEDTRPDRPYVSDLMKAAGYEY